MKNQWSQFPFVLRCKILLTFLAGIASIAVSLVIFTVAADRILLVLGGFIFAASLVLGSSLWRTAAGEAKRPKILQSVLLPVGDGPDTCGRELPVVRSANHYHRWGRADLLQPGMRGGRPVCFAGISQRQSPNQCRRYPAMAGKADTGRQSEQKRSTWEASPSCMRNDQHVHRPGWIDRNHPLSFAV